MTTPPVQPRPKRPAPTVDSIKDGLAKLLARVQELQAETRALRRHLGEFTAGRDLRPPLIFRDHWDQHSETDQPKCEIEEMLWEYRGTENLAIPTRAILAIAKEIDGALHDIRATREEIRVIAGDADHSADWKVWQEDHK